MPKVIALCRMIFTVGNVVVLGVGNLLLKDEGVGVKVVQKLQEEEVPSHVELVDGATLGLNLLPLFEEAEKVIIVDCVKGGESPGTVYKFGLDEVKKKDKGVRLSLHDIDLTDVMNLVKTLKKNPPQVVILGIEPKEIDWGMELSPEVEKAIPKVLEEIRKEF